MENFIKDSYHTHGVSVYHQKKAITYIEKFMKESMENTSPTTHWSEKHCYKVTIGLPCLKMLKNSFNNTTSARNLPVLIISLLILNIQLGVHGHLQYGEWIFLDHFRSQ